MIRFHIITSAMNKFGHSLTSKRKHTQIIHTHTGFAFTNDGDYNIENRKLCNVKGPTNGEDASTKQYVDSTILENMKRFEDAIKTLENKVDKILPDLNTKINEIQTFIKRTKPTASHHMATKKYVDDSIVAAKGHIRGEIGKAKKEILSSIKPEVTKIMENEFNMLEKKISTTAKKFANPSTPI